MRTKAWKYLPPWLTTVVWLIPLVCLPITPVSSEEKYRFERLWPTLQQPWYFYYPLGVAVDGNGNIYVADSNNYRIQKFTSGGQFVATWGSRGEEEGEFNDPAHVAVDDSDYVYVADAAGLPAKDNASAAELT